MKTLTACRGGAVVGASVSMTFLGAGAAVAAPDVVGRPYGDAVTEIEDDGGTAHVAVTVGARLPRDECIVTNAWDSRPLQPMSDDVYYEFAEDRVMLALNCAGGHATATNPGASVGSPAGREAKAAADEAASAEAGDLEEVSTPDE